MQQFLIQVKIKKSLFFSNHFLLFCFLCSVWIVGQAVLALFLYWLITLLVCKDYIMQEHNHTLIIIIKEYHL